MLHRAAATSGTKRACRSTSASTPATWCARETTYTAAPCRWQRGYRASPRRARYWCQNIVRGLARTSAGVAFEDYGEHELKGIDEPQRLFVVRAEGPPQETVS